jgi:hypothetical protein
MYRHDQLWECFDAAVQVTKELPDELAKGPEYVVPLMFDGEYFAAGLGAAIAASAACRKAMFSSSCPGMGLTKTISSPAASASEVVSPPDLETIRSLIAINSGISLTYPNTRTGIDASCARAAMACRSRSSFTHANKSCAGRGSPTPL